MILTILSGTHFWFHDHDRDRDFHREHHQDHDHDHLQRSSPPWQGRHTPGSFWCPPQLPPFLNAQFSILSLSIFSISSLSIFQFLILSLLLFWWPCHLPPFQLSSVQFSIINLFNFPSGFLNSSGKINLAVFALSDGQNFSFWNLLNAFLQIAHVLSVGLRTHPVLKCR